MVVSTRSSSITDVVRLRKSALRWLVLRPSLNPALRWRMMKSLSVQISLQVISCQLSVFRFEYVAAFALTTDNCSLTTDLEILCLGGQLQIHRVKRLVFFVVTAKARGQRGL